jgi:hypothetical protein
MSSYFHIRFVPYKEIDLAKWDHCISTATNGLVYGYSWYLDHMAKQWDALVLDDYDAVMPLTWNRKYGIAYLYQPFLTAQLGVFGKDVSAEQLESFLQAIPAKFLYWDIYLNYRNMADLKNFHLYQRRNYILELDKSYDTLYNGYRENIRRNTRKAEQLGCTPVKDIAIQKVIDLAVEQMRAFTKESSDNVARFIKLYKYLHDRQQAITYGILNAKKELVASCVFIFSHNRAYYILVGNHPDGRTIGASHSLIDAFIKDHADKKMILDFEGSDIRNLAFFYSSFGAIEENYAAIKLNRLPFYLKWLKK